MQERREKKPSRSSPITDPLAAALALVALVALAAADALCQRDPKNPRRECRVNWHPQLFNHKLLLLVAVAQKKQEEKDPLFSSYNLSLSFGPRFPLDNVDTKLGQWIVCSGSS